MIDKEERIKPKGFYVYLDTEEELRILTDEERGKLFSILFEYATNGEEPEIKDNRPLLMAFVACRRHIDRDYKEYEKKCRINRLNGQKGGAPKGNQNAKKNNTIVGNSTENNPTLEETTENTVESSNNFNYQAVVNSFNSICVSLPKIQKLTDTRKKKIKNLQHHLGDVSIEDYFTMIEQSDFLTGRTGKWGNCNFDWILNPTNLTKIIEGNYNNKESPHTQKPSYDIRELEKRGSLYNF